MHDVKRLIDNPELLLDLFNPDRGAANASIQELDCKSLPNLPGLYVVAGTSEMHLVSLEQIYYVGVSTTSIRERWRNHHKMVIFNAIENAVMQFQDYSSIYCPDRTFPYKSSFLDIFCWPNPFASPKDLLDIERELIFYLKPQCNKLATGKNTDSGFDFDLFLQTSSKQLTQVIQQVEKTKEELNLSTKEFSEIKDGLHDG